MVNLQDLTIFACQVLNRDIWKDEQVLELIKDKFIFLQVSSNFHQYRNNTYRM
jgi:hypothetical protein